MTKPSRGRRPLKPTLSTIIFVLILAGAVTPPRSHAQEKQDRGNSWDREAAARYLDARIDLWFERATELKTGEGKTTCISCHTVVPYLLARPVLRKAMHVNEPTRQEARLLQGMTLRTET